MSYTVNFVRENPMLNRKQAAISISHPGVNAPSKADAKEKIAKQLKVSDANAIIIIGMKTNFGGGKTKCLALAYDSLADAKKNDKCYRLLRMGIETEFSTPKMARRARKDLATASAKVRGAAKTKLMQIRKKK